MAASRAPGISSRKSLHPASRGASIVLGGALLGRALESRSPLAWAAGVVGTALFYRGVRGDGRISRPLSLPSRARRDEEGASDSPNEVVESITVQGSSEELYRRFSDSHELPRIMGHFADVELLEHRARWRTHPAFGLRLEWETELVEAREPDCLRWKSLPGSEMPNEGEVTFHPAPGEWGTVVTLRFRFDPPGGALGSAVATKLGLVPRTLVREALHRFKALAEAGEIPARAGGWAH